MRVHYRTADPEESTLETGVTLASMIVLAAGIALIAWGCGVFNFLPAAGSSGMQ